MTHLAVAMLVLLTGCSEGALLVRETPQGGIVSYAYRETTGPMFSRHRAEALEIIAGKCPSGYSIIQEAEVRGYSAQGSAEGTEGDPTRRWGLEFKCKTT